MRETGTILLSNGSETVFWLGHEELVNPYRWQGWGRNGKVYAYRFRRALEDYPTQKIYLHRWLAYHELGGDAIYGKMIDHADSNSLNNTWNNLRVVCPVRNAWNKSNEGQASQFTGVTYEPARRGRSKWRARLTLADRTRVHIGYFATEMEAMEAVDRRSFEVYGDTALTNARLPLLSCVAPEADSTTFDIPF